MRKMNQGTTESLTVGQVARHCRVNRRTVQRWIQEGKLEAHSLPSGHYRVTLPVFRRFVETYEIPVDLAAVGATRSRFMIIEADDATVQSLRADLSLIREDVETEAAGNVIDACLRLSLFRPEVVFIGHGMHREFNAAVVRHMRQIEELAGALVVLVRPISTGADDQDLVGIDCVLDWPAPSGELEKILKQALG